MRTKLSGSASASYNGFSTQLSLMYGSLHSFVSLVAPLCRIIPHERQRRFVRHNIRIIREPDIIHFSKESGAVPAAAYTLLKGI